MNSSTNNSSLEKPQAPLYSEATLRDWFAASALNGMVYADTAGNYSNAELAQVSYELADAMLAERGK